jgi:formate-dependent nitrite reductase cytochrome c552 subunit
MIKKAFGGLLALSLITAPATVFAAPGHGAHKEVKNYIKQEQKRVNTQIKQVVKKEAEIAKQKVKLVKEQLKTNPALNQVLQQIVKLEVKQAQDRKAILTAIAGNKFDAAQTALAALKADYDQITALRAQLKNGTAPTPIPVTPVPTTDPTSDNSRSQTPAPTGDTVTMAPTDNSGASAPTPVETTPVDSTSTPAQP